MMSRQLIPLVCLGMLVAGCGGSHHGLADGEPPPADARHVAPGGDDGGAGTAQNPWATIQHAADTLEAGETVCIHAGVYAEDVRLSRSGLADSPTVLRTMPGEEVTVRSFEFAPGASRISLRGFAVKGYAIWGVTLEGNNHHISLSELEVTGGEVGIRLTVGDSGQPPWFGPVSHVTIEDTRIRDTLYAGIDGTPGPCDQLIVRKVEVSGAGLGGEDSFAADGVSIEKGRDLLVEDCRVHDNGGDGIDLNSRDAHVDVGEIRVLRNSVFRNHLNGIKLWAGGRMEGNVLWGQGINPLDVGMFDCTAVVVNNTIAYNMWDAGYGARDYAATFGYAEPGQDPPAILLTLRANIFAYNTGPAQGTPTGIYLGRGVQFADEGDNLFFSREDEEIFADFIGPEGREFSRQDIAGGAWAAATNTGDGDLVVDPRFVSGWPEVDLRLRPDSPAAGRGGL